MEEFLTEQPISPHAKGAGLAGILQREDDEEQRTTLGLVTSYVRDATLGWQYTIDHLSLYFERALAVHDEDCARERGDQRQPADAGAASGAGADGGVAGNGSKTWRTCSGFARQSCTKP